MTASTASARSKQRGYVVTGGGTAGHVVPALAVADALVAKGVDAKLIHYVGSRRGFEVRALAATPYPFLALPGRGIRRSFRPKALLDNLVALFGLGFALLHALFSLGRWRPRAVISLGGYAAFPASCAAVLLRRPLVLVNVDAVAGAVNRLLARFAVASAVALPGTDLPRPVVTGAPLRQAFDGLSRTGEAQSQARKRLAISEKQVISVVGGSLGAGALNELVVDLVKTWTPQSSTMIYHVAGNRFADSLREQASTALHDGDLTWRLMGFEEEMLDLYLASDLVIARSGAMTVAELAATGTPSLLAPLPGAPNDHQRHNAERLASHGAARIIDLSLPGSALTIARELDLLLADRSLLEAMSHAARALAPDHAAAAVAELVERSGR